MKNNVQRRARRAKECGEATATTEQLGTSSSEERQDLRGLALGIRGPIYLARTHNTVQITLRDSPCLVGLRLQFRAFAVQARPESRCQDRDREKETQDSCRCQQDRASRVYGEGLMKS